MIIMMISYLAGYLFKGEIKQRAFLFATTANFAAAVITCKFNGKRQEVGFFLFTFYAHHRAELN
jgi:hypothetical protein